MYAINIATEALKERYSITSINKRFIRSALDTPLTLKQVNELVKQIIEDSRFYQNYGTSGPKRAYPQKQYWLWLNPTLSLIQKTQLLI